jgi:hypothetical protein
MTGKITATLVADDHNLCVIIEDLVSTSGQTVID